MRKKRNLKDDTKLLKKRDEFGTLCDRAKEKVEEARERGDNVALRKWGTKLQDYATRRDTAQLMIDSRHGLSRHRLRNNPQVRETIRAVQTKGR